MGHIYRCQKMFKTDKQKEIRREDKAKIFKYGEYIKAGKIVPAFCVKTS